MPSAILDHKRIGERYFFPRADAVSDPFVVDTGAAQLACHLATPHDDAPLLLHFHGNGEVAADWVDTLGAHLIDTGVNVCFAEYRGYGGSTGTPSMVSMLADALAVADATGVPPAKCVVYGRSVGSIYALHVAAHRRVAGLVIESGIADVRERITLRVTAAELGTSDDELDAAIAETFDHRAKMACHDAPVLIMHARNDHLVSMAHAEMLAEWAGVRGRLLLFERGNHNTIYGVNRAALHRALLGFIQSSASRVP